MTARQTYAIFCKTGYDVRGLGLDNSHISAILKNYWQESAEYIRENFPNARRRMVPTHKGENLQREYSLLYERALQAGAVAYQANEATGCKGIASVSVSRFTSGFGRYLSKLRDNGKKELVVTVNYGPSLAGNLEAANVIARYLAHFGQVDAAAFSG